MGNETDQQEVSQTCLEALCYMSVSIAPTNTIPFALEMIWKVAQSESWKAKMSSLEFTQTFVFTNFMSLCLHPEYVKQVENFIINLRITHCNVNRHFDLSDTIINSTRRTHI